MKLAKGVAVQPRSTLQRVPSDHVNSKALSLLAAGCVRVLDASGTAVTAEVQGSRTEPYDVTYNWPIGAGWRCSCPAPGECSHIVAVDRVWSPEPTGVPALHLVDLWSDPDDDGAC